MMKIELINGTIITIKEPEEPEIVTGCNPCPPICEDIPKWEGAEKFLKSLIHIKHKE